MNKLLEKIRKILSDRRIRRKIKFVVSVISAIIVFVSTYALILPAITEEKIAACGIEEHQHTDDCYTEELICDIPESEGHEHTDSCFTVKRVLSCDASEHVHDENCYDENGELICTVDEHVHDDQCYREVKELTCGTEESEGHTHGASCYEKKLTCGKEVHVHSVDCYEMDENSASQSEAGKDSDSAAPNDVLDDASDGALDETSDRSRSQGRDYCFGGDGERFNMHYTKAVLRNGISFLSEHRFLSLPLIHLLRFLVHHRAAAFREKCNSLILILPERKGLPHLEKNTAAFLYIARTQNRTPKGPVFVVKKIQLCHLQKSCRENIPCPGIINKSNFQSIWDQRSVYSPLYKLLSGFPSSVSMFFSISSHSKRRMRLVFLRFFRLYF